MITRAELRKEQERRIAAEAELAALRANPPRQSEAQEVERLRKALAIANSRLAQYGAAQVEEV